MMKLSHLLSRTSGISSQAASSGRATAFGRDPSFANWCDDNMRMLRSSAAMLGLVAFYVIIALRCLMVLYK